MKNTLITKQRLKPSLSKKILAYTNLSLAFILTTNSAEAQCGTAFINSPLLIDIDEDGTNDLSINFVTEISSSNPFSTSFIYSSNATESIYFAPISASTFVSSNFSYMGCQRALIANQGDYFNIPASIYNQNVTAFGSALVYKTYDVYRQYISNIGSYAFQIFAYAQGSNQIIGLNTNNSTVNVCSILGSNPSLSGPNNVAIGFNSSVIYNNVVYEKKKNRNTFQLGAYATVPSSIFPQSTCFTSMFSSYFMSFMGANPLIYVPGYILSSSTGTFSFSTIEYNNNDFFNNTLSTNALAVKFASAGKTHNGWVQLSIDANTGIVSCVNKGYNSCSIEDATALSTASNSCIEIGQTDPSINCCIPDLNITNFYNANPEFKVSNNIVSNANANTLNQTTVNFSAEYSVELTNGFCIESGVDFLAEIAPCQ